MRIISQNGKTNVPFDNCTIQEGDGLIWGYVSGIDSFILAEYRRTTTSGAAMEVLEEAWLKGAREFQFPKDYE